MYGATMAAIMSTASARRLPMKHALDDRCEVVKLWQVRNFVLALKVCEI